MLVRVFVAKHRGHMLPPLVRERAMADEGLLQWKREVGDLRHRA